MYAWGGGGLLPSPVRGGGPMFCPLCGELLSKGTVPTRPRPEWGWTTLPRKGPRIRDQVPDTTQTHTLMETLPSCHTTYGGKQSELDIFPTRCRTCFPVVSGDFSWYCDIQRIHPVSVSATFLTKGQVSKRYIKRKKRQKRPDGVC